MTGKTRLEHPSQRRPRLLRHHHPSFFDQHRLDRRLQRHCLIGRSLPPLLVYYFICLPHRQTHPPRTLSPRSLESRQTRLVGECCFGRVFGVDLVLFVFPVGESSGCGTHELERGDLFFGDRVRRGVLSFGGEEGVCRARGAGQEFVSGGGWRKGK